MRLRCDDFVFNPEQLRMMCAAYDAAWEQVASEYDHSPTSIDIGRLRLANAVLAAYQSGVRDEPMIKAVALRRMAVWHREPRSSGVIAGCARAAH